eukprot:Skav212066  [mRNA]  locus=scaffold2639:76303:86913:- [translate_table: standard]
MARIAARWAHFSEKQSCDRWMSWWNTCGPWCRDSRAGPQGVPGIHGYTTEVAGPKPIVRDVIAEVSSDLDSSVRKAQRKAKALAAQFPNLSQDECAIITLYTMEMYPPDKSLYFVLNEALRAQKREKVKPWRDVILLLLTAMKKLPPVQDRVVHRAVKVHARDLGTLATCKQATADEEFMWAGFSSTTTHVGSMQDFLGTTGGRTNWVLHLSPNFHAVKIQDFSLFPTENEILLPPNMEFRVKSVLDCGNDLTMVQCDQLEETDPLMDFSIAKAAATSSTSYAAAFPPAAPQPAQEASPSSSAAAPSKSPNAGTPTTAGASAEASPSSSSAAPTKSQDAGTPATTKVDWFSLGQKGGGTVDGKSYTKKAPSGWDELHGPVISYHRVGYLGALWLVITAKLTVSAPEECYIRALEVDEAHSEAWKLLGFGGGGTMNGRSFDAKACYIRAVEADEKNDDAWLFLGRYSGGAVNGVHFDAAACFVRSLELWDKGSVRWCKLGEAGGGIVHGQSFDAKQWFIRALELKETYADAWHLLGAAGGGTVKGQFYDPAACQRKYDEIKARS